MSANAARFGRIVRARRLALGDLTQIDVWRRGGPSNSTLTAIEGGDWKPNGPTFRKLDAALEWEPGSARRAWDGGEPTPATPRPEAPAHRRAAVDASDAEIVAEVARRMSVAREERDHGRDAAAKSRAGGSPVDPTLSDDVVAIVEDYWRAADVLRRSGDGRDAIERALKDLRKRAKTQLEDRLARERPDSTRSVG